MDEKMEDFMSWKEKTMDEKMEDFMSWNEQTTDETMEELKSIEERQRSIEELKRSIEERQRRGKEEMQELQRQLAEIQNETKEGVKDFVEDNVEELQEEALKSASAKNGLDENFSCSGCATESLTKIAQYPAQSSTIPPAKQCNNKLCNDVKSTFRNDHHFNKPTWENSDAKKWGTDPIEVAKLFMPRGYKDKENFEDVDLHGHLNVIVNSKTARGKLADPKVAEKAKEFTSRVRHMSEDTMTLGDFVEGADVYLRLLNDQAIIKYPKAVESVKKIEKIIDDVIGSGIFDHLRKLLHLSQSPMHSTDVLAMTKCLFNTKDGVCDFTMDAARDLQYYAFTKVRKEQRLASDATCDQCSTEDLIPLRQRRGKAQYRPCCPSGYCDSIRDFLVDQHIFNNPFWHNTDAKKWSTHPWELVKVFMQHGYKDSEGAFVVDFNGLINIGINCKYMSNKLNDPSVAVKARDVSRKRRHAGYLEVNKDELEEAIDAYTALLKEPAIAKNARAKEALKLIEDVSQSLEE